MREFYEFLKFMKFAFSIYGLHEKSMYTINVHGAAAANAGSATFSAYVGSCTHTYWCCCSRYRRSCRTRHHGMTL